MDSGSRLRFRHTIKNTFIIQAIFGSVLILVTILGLLLPPRQLFLWLPSVLILVAAMILVAALLAFDYGWRFQNLHNFSVCIASEAIGIGLLMISFLLLAYGCTTKFTKIGLVIPLAILILLQVVLCSWTIVLTCRLRNSFKRRTRNSSDAWTYRNGSSYIGPASMPSAQAGVTTAQNAQSTTAQKYRGAIGQQPIFEPPPHYSEAVGLSRISRTSDGTDVATVPVQSAYSSGSVNTMYTMTSDL